MKDLPAIPYIRIVKMFALAKGLKFFTWNDVTKASILYLETAKYLN